MNKKALKICLTCFASFLILVFVFGPREPVQLGTGYDNIMIGDDIDAYLAMREGQFDDIIDGVEKQVIWAGEANVKTPLSHYLPSWLYRQFKRNPASAGSGGRRFGRQSLFYPLYRSWPPACGNDRCQCRALDG